MTAENIIRLEMYKSNKYLTIIKSASRFYGGRIGAELTKDLQDAEWDIERYEKSLRPVDK